jgi:hypothetical protein
MEQEVSENGANLSALDMEALEAHWRSAKSRERAIAGRRKD